ncbi:hypothetical protein BH09SUM1_BH09SUM1_32550 [soil metagenome]
MGVAFCEPVTLESARLESKAKTVVAVADISAKTLLCLIAIADMVKETRAAAIRTLTEKEKLQVWLITSDNLRTATAIAKVVGIAPEHVLAGVKPEDKARKIEELQKAGHQVAMVGDGACRDSADSDVTATYPGYDRSRYTLWK